MSPVPDTPQSSYAEGGEFNMGIATLRRIDTLLSVAHEARLGQSDSAPLNGPGQRRIWVQVLHGVYLEIEPYLKPEEINDIVKQRKIINTSFTKTKMSEWINIYTPIENYERLLRKTKYMLKLLMPSADDPGVAFRKGRG